MKLSAKAANTWSTRLLLMTEERCPPMSRLTEHRDFFFSSFQTYLQIFQGRHMSKFHIHILRVLGHWSICEDCGANSADQDLVPWQQQCVFLLWFLCCWQCLCSKITQHLLGEPSRTTTCNKHVSSHHWPQDSPTVALDSEYTVSLLKHQDSNYQTLQGLIQFT